MINEVPVVIRHFQSVVAGTAEMALVIRNAAQTHWYVQLYRISADCVYPLHLNHYTTEDKALAAYSQYVKEQP